MKKNKLAVVKLICILFFCLCRAPVFSADDFFNAGGLYLNAAADLYFDTEDDSSSRVMPGVRGGGGWEIPFNHSSLSLGVETGVYFKNNQGDAPIPTTISLNAIYSYLFNRRFALGAGVLGGAFFAPKEHTNVVVPFFGPRLFGEWTFAHRPDGSRFVSLYLGGGVDVNIDKDDGTSVLPLAELGVRFRFGTPATNFGTSMREPSNSETVQEKEPVDEEQEEDFYLWDEYEDPYFILSPLTPEPEKPISTQETEPVVEPEPEPLPNSGPEKPLASGIIPRGNRLLVRLPDGRRGFILDECTIYFGPDQTNLPPKEEVKLRRAVQLLTQYPASRFVIAGYTAWAGTEQGRNIISWERARNVTDYLVRRGIKAGRAEVHWYGAAQPAVPNTSKANMVRNRRIEFIILEE